MLGNFFLLSDLLFLIVGSSYVAAVTFVLYMVKYEWIILLVLIWWS